MEQFVNAPFKDHPLKYLDQPLAMVSGSITVHVDGEGPDGRIGACRREPPPCLGQPTLMILIKARSAGLFRRLPLSMHLHGLVPVQRWCRLQSYPGTQKA